MTTMGNPKIIVVEDDQDICHLLKLELDEHGFDASTYQTGMRGLLAIREVQPDLVIIDLGLPDLSGAEVARRVRSTSDIPIIILTAAHDVDTKVKMLNHGADDYLAKPFHLSELVARVNVQLRKRDNTKVQQLGELSIDHMSRQIMCGEEEVKLSPREYQLVTYLCSQPGRVYSRKEIEQNVWGPHLPQSSNVVDVHIANIRAKLRDSGGFGIIRTARGIGYAVKG